MISIKLKTLRLGTEALLGSRLLSCVSGMKCEHEEQAHSLGPAGGTELCVGL